MRSSLWLVVAATAILASVARCQEATVEAPRDLRLLLAPEAGEAFVFEPDPNLRDPFRSPLTRRVADVEAKDPSRAQAELPEPSLDALRRDRETIETANKLVRNMQEKSEGDESALVEVVELCGQLQALEVEQPKMGAELEELKTRGKELAARASERVFDVMWQRANGLLARMHEKLEAEDFDGIKEDFEELEKVVAGMSFDKEMKARFERLESTGAAIVKQGEDIRDFRENVEPGVQVSGFVRLEDKACVIIGGTVYQPGESLPGDEPAKIVAVTESTIVFLYRGTNVTMRYGLGVNY